MYAILHKVLSLSLSLSRKTHIVLLYEKMAEFSHIAYGDMCVHTRVSRYALDIMRICMCHRASRTCVDTVMAVYSRSGIPAARDVRRKESRGRIYSCVPRFHANLIRL